MQLKTREDIQKSVFNIVALVQIVLSVVWIIFRGSFSIPSFTDNALQSASINLTLDEYTGLIYPVFLRFFMLTGNGVAGVIMLYVIQLAAVTLAGIFFLRAVNKLSATAVLYLITFPLVLQAVTSVSVYGFEISLFLLMAGLLFGDDTKYKNVYVGLTVLGSILLSLSFGIIVTVIFVICAIKKLAKKDWQYMIVIAVAVITAIFLLGIFITPGANKKMPGTFGTALMSNMAASHLEEDYYFWSDEVKEAVPFETLSDIVKSREYAVTSLGEVIFKKLDYSKAVKASWNIAFASIKNRSKETIITVLSGYKDYLVMPVTMLKNTRGIGKSVTAYNIKGFGGSIPLYSKVYLFASFILFFVYVIVRSVICLADNKEIKNPGIITTGLLIWIGLSGIYSIFSIQYFDYFKMLPAFSLLLLIAVPAVPALKIAEKETAGNRLSGERFEKIK